MQKRIFTPEEINQIAEDYSKGMSIDGLKKKNAAGYRNIVRVLTEAGIDTRQRPKGRLSLFYQQVRVHTNQIEALQMQIKILTEMVKKCQK